jgi:hypothetical protein
MFASRGVFVKAGRAPTLEEAKAQFGAGWEAFKGEL